MAEIYISDTQLLTVLHIFHGFHQNVPIKNLQITFSIYILNSFGLFSLDGASESMK